MVEGVFKVEKKEGGSGRVIIVKGLGVFQDSDFSVICSVDEVDEFEGGDKNWLLFLRFSFFILIGDFWVNVLFQKLLDLKQLKQ